MKPNMHHLFRFVDFGKICNMNAQLSGRSSCEQNLKQNGVENYIIDVYICMCIHMCACVCICVWVYVCIRVCLSVGLFVCTILQCDMCMKMSCTVLLLLPSGHTECWQSSDGKMAAVDGPH